eukprot:1201619-Prymnesium_polylepis.1
MAGLGLGLWATGDSLEFGPHRPYGFTDRERRAGRRGHSGTAERGVRWHAVARPRVGAGSGGGPRRARHRGYTMESAASGCAVCPVVSSVCASPLSGESGACGTLVAL